MIRVNNCLRDMTDFFPFSFFGTWNNARRACFQYVGKQKISYIFKLLRMIFYFFKKKSKGNTDLYFF